MNTELQRQRKGDEERKVKERKVVRETKKLIRR